MPFSSLVICFLIIATIMKTAGSIGCQIDPKILNPQPIVILKDSLDFLYPLPGQSMVQLEENQEIDIICSKGDNVFIENERFPFITSARCIEGNRFDIDNRNISFPSIKCGREIENQVRFTGNSCSVIGRELDIGFPLQNDRFLSLIKVCFDDQNKIPLYTQHRITASIGGRESHVPRRFFTENQHVFGFQVNDFYLRPFQRRAVKNVLPGCNSREFIRDGNAYFLSRGHLSPKGDFYYAYQQSATFNYANAAPQWQPFNGENWNQVEIHARDYAENKRVDLGVVTGTFGVLKIADRNRKEALYLKNGNQFPVPEYYWKIVYDKNRKSGFVILGLNNPYVRDFQFLCPDISSRIPWIPWGLSNAMNGIIYACTLPDFQKINPNLPNLEINNENL